jgi:hypothetical protein
MSLASGVLSKFFSSVIVSVPVVAARPMGTGFAWSGRRHASQNGSEGGPRTRFAATGPAGQGQRCSLQGCLAHHPPASSLLALSDRSLRVDISLLDQSLMK